MKPTFLMLSLLLVFAACKKEEAGDSAPKNGEKGATGGNKSKGGGNDSDNPVVGMLADDLKEVEQEIKDGKASLISCASVLSYAEDLAKEKAGTDLVQKAEKLCMYDVPMVIATKAVEEAEAARKKSPDADPLSECYSADWESANEELVKKHKDDDALKNLTERWNAACPPKK